MNKIENNSSVRRKIQELLDSKKYIGEMSAKGFILKRNFGVRRLPIYGNAEGDFYRLKIKNEVIHETLLWISVFMMSLLTLFSLWNQIYEIAIICIIFLLLIYLMNRQRIKDELKYFHQSIAELEMDESTH